MLRHLLEQSGLCSVVAAELAFGVAKSGSIRNRQALEMFLAPLTILPFDEAAVWAYGDLRANLERRWAGSSMGPLTSAGAINSWPQNGGTLPSTPGRLQRMEDTPPEQPSGVR